MPQKDLKKYLLDILDAIEGIEQISSGLAIEDLNKLGYKWALERGIAIIGEALYKANNIDRTLPITDLAKIISTRHIIIHEYDIVDPVRMLTIIQKHLPLLKQEVGYILKNLTQDGHSIN